MWLFDGVNGHEVRSAGTEQGARIRVTAGHLGWADLVVTLEKRHVSRLRDKFADTLASRRLVCLHIPDEYAFMDPALVERLERQGVRVAPLVLVLWGLAGCQTSPPPATGRATPASRQPAAAMAGLPGAREYRVDPARSLLQILVYRGGPMARLGHNHVIEQPQRRVPA